MAINTDTHLAWPRTDAESQELIDRCASLKRRLTEYALANLRDVIEGMAASFSGKPMSEYDVTMIIEDAIYTTGRSGASVLEVFARDLPEPERQIALGWSDWIYGVFEVREAELPFLSARNLVDDLDYRLFVTNLTQHVRDRFTPGMHILSRAARVRDRWMLSGMQRLYPASARQSALGMAATLAMRMPRMFFRNPLHIQRGRERDRLEHERFLACFGAPWIAGPPSEVVRQYNELFVPESARTLGTESPAMLSLPRELNACRSVGVISDPLHGIFFVPDFGDFLRALDAPATWGEPGTREMLLSLLEASGTTPAVFGACASHRPHELDAMLATALERPGFSWAKDGDALMRQHNPRFLDEEPIPTTLVLEHEMAEAHRATLQESNRQAASGSQRQPGDKRARNKTKATRKKRRK